MDQDLEQYYVNRIDSLNTKLNAKLNELKTALYTEQKARMQADLLQMRLLQAEGNVLNPATFAIAVNKTLRKHGLKHRLNHKKIVTQKDLVQQISEIFWYCCNNDSEVYD